MRGSEDSQENGTIIYGSLQKLGGVQNRPQRIIVPIMRTPKKGPFCFWKPLHVLVFNYEAPTVCQCFAARQSGDATFNRAAGLHCSGVLAGSAEHFTLLGCFCKFVWLSL